MFKKILLTAAVAASLVAASQADAHADYLFDICPSGQSGVATNVTSCAFADNTRAAYFYDPATYIESYSPVTGQVYDMYCAQNTVRFSYGSPRLAIRCDGGSNAVVVFW